MATYAYEIWDVFASRPFAGNPLAVVWNADDLDTVTMQALAKEFNLAETVFISAPTKPECVARLRIFTPAYEMPYAGHPTVGASIALATRRTLGRDFALELNAGVFAINARPAAAAPGFAAFVNPNLPTVTAEGPDARLIEAALGLADGAVDSGAHAPRRVGAGVDFLYAKAPLDAVRAARLDTAAFAALGLGETVGVLLYADGGDAKDATFHVRMFAPGAGVPEDPATGSASAALPGQIAAAGALADGTHRWIVEQGVEIGRPSRIELDIDAADGAPTRVRVGGEAVRVMTGEMDLS
ncbi:MAG: PhzF family phenazine biosynthesis protein [Parvularculaceae bacterium]